VNERGWLLPFPGFRLDATVSYPNAWLPQGLTSFLSSLLFRASFPKPLADSFDDFILTLVQLSYV
jgi:hypothetical protein